MESHWLTCGVDVDGDTALKLLYLYAFWVDNVLASFQAAALYEVLPVTLTGSVNGYTLLYLLAYDAILCLFCLGLSYGVLAYWKNYQQTQSLSSNANHKVAIREQFLHLVTFAAVFTMGGGHKTVAYYAWFALENAFFGSSNYNSCNDRSAAWIVLGSILFTVLVGMLFLGISLYFLKLHDQSTDENHRVLHLIVAESLSFGLGWLAFNMTEIIFKCELSFMYDNVWGEIIRAVAMFSLGFLVYHRWSHKRESQDLVGGAHDDNGGGTGGVPAAPESDAQGGEVHSMGKVLEAVRKACSTMCPCGSSQGDLGRTVRRWEGRLRHFGDQIVLLVVSLTIMYVYYAPLERNYNDGVIVGWMFFAGFAVLFLSSWYGFTFGFPDPSDFTSADASFRAYAFGVMGWTAGFSFWYGFNTALSDWLGSSDEYGDDASFTRRFWAALVTFVVVGVILALIASGVMHVIYSLSGDDFAHVTYEAGAHPVNALRIIPSLRQVESGMNQGGHSGAAKRNNSLDDTGSDDVETTTLLGSESKTN